METKIASQKLNKNLEQVIESPTEQFESSKKNIILHKDTGSFLAIKYLLS